MAWIATDEDGSIALFINKPERKFAKTLKIGEIAGYWTRRNSFDNPWCEIAKYQSKKLIGKVLTWEDEPVELK